LRLVVEHPDTHDEVEIVLQTDNRDAVRFDRMRRVYKWPALDEAPMLWYAVLAWSAIARSGTEPWASSKVDTFVDELLVDAEPVDSQGRPIRVDPSTGLPVDEDEASANPTDPASG
jgi:hypothetical protein